MELYKPAVTKKQLEQTCRRFEGERALRILNDGETTMMKATPT